MSIKAKIYSIIILVVATNMLLGLMGLYNLNKVQSSLEESLESRAKNSNLLRTVGIDFHQMYLAEKNLYLYKPGTEDFKAQLEEYNGQKEDIEELASMFKDMLGLGAHSVVKSGILFFVFFLLGANLLCFAIWRFSGKREYSYWMFLLSGAQYIMGLA